MRLSRSPGWLAVEPRGGRILAGQSADLEVRLDATEMLGGDYSARIDVLSNDPDEGTSAIPVSLHVIGAPDIALTETVLSFGTQFIGVARSDTFQVRNPGTDVLQVSTVTTDDSDYRVTPTAFTLAPGEARAVVVTFLPSRPGTIDATLRTKKAELRARGVTPDTWDREATGITF